jgi:hypothetical protein
MGMLKASQKRTNLAAFTEALISRQPEMGTFAVATELNYFKLPAATFG